MTVVPARSLSCGHCGETALGWATIDNVRVCHDEERDCYRQVTVFGATLGSAGVRAKALQEGRRRVIFANLHAVLDHDATDRWLATPIPDLDGRTPQELLDAGELQPLRELTELYLDPSFG